MKCPACQNALIEMIFDDIEVDVCRGGCGGIWFDPFELQKVDEPHESIGEVLMEIQRDEGIVPDASQRRRCPKCKDTVMMRHFFSIKHEVEVDECASCGGFWLDYGELKKIRSQFDSEEERREAADKYFSELFDQELEELNAESLQKMERTKKFAHMLRFLCPSYYIPGKQKWGAF